MITVRFVSILFTGYISKIVRWELEIDVTEIKWESGGKILPLYINELWFAKEELKLIFS